ncbi:MAG: tetratricopeptide repeat protein [Acidobacteria bacterium]|nr:tetratricopeptide repeat protein [Acidobacteriota bacterium]NIM62078.1 tetratricopeptide repeat protein [Acidobacteriota bacterium]NIO59727.1 tetratricopeptide repeat protein [Acidobacteriota bacterium]NIQ30816.1 tetratricopeptide repeat protein [Acidobacteriota bacterium]NIQ85878.1 tetratricopeptide repeat protein [Acidobacteriota bacterium]
MGSDSKRSLAAGEKLLKAGKVAEAIAEFDRVVETCNGDLLTVNRVGDAIVASGNPEKAVPYYARIADQFCRQGFYPKAIAIRKKILRLTPESAEALVGLGDLYVRQEHPAEARSYYLRAADLLLNGKDFAGAKEVYQRLVDAEPDDPRHRVRLAETRAAAGETEEAAGDLVELGQRLLESGKPEDAEKAFRRASELVADRPEVISGLIACLTETGRDEEAQKLLEEEVAKPEAAIALVAELLALYEVNGHTEKADALFAAGRAHELPDETFSTLARFHDRKDGQAGWWSRIEPALKRWKAEPHRTRLLALLDAWPTWTDAPLLPALEWRLALADEQGDESVQVRVLEQLVGAYKTRDMDAEAEEAQGRLDELRPPAEAAPESATVQAAEPEPGQDEEAIPATPEAEPAKDVPIEFEAPAVPLSRADEEFVSGRMTQAEILEKYGLLTQAMDQIYEVIERFPGHLEANQHLVTLLRGTSQQAALGQALVKLALARRAAGRLEVGQQAAAEADKLGGIDPETRQILAALDLFADESAPRATPAVEAPTPAPVLETAPAVQPSGGDAVIDFDAMDEDEDADDTDEEPAIDVAPVEEPAVTLAEPEEVAAPVPVADPEKVAEPPQAAAPVAEQPKEAADSRGTEAAMRFEPLPDIGDGQEDDDLSAIAAALDDELFDDDPLDAPSSESEESLDEVFAAFRERVEQEVGADDYRTHYDLGIGYKEMGLVDAAVAEFRISAKSADLFQESCVMLALCCRELDQLDQAANWYRQALDTIDDGNAGAFDLRYDLADVLLASGDTGSALDLFRDLHQLDPGFRDVAERVTQLSGAVSE